MASKVPIIIYDYVRRALVKSSEGIASLPNKQAIVSSMQDIFNRLKSGGYNAVTAEKAIKNQDDLRKVLNTIDSKEIADIKKRKEHSERLARVMDKMEKGIPLNPSDQYDKSGGVLDAFQGFKPKVIQGGKSEKELLEKMNKQNKEGIERIKKRKETDPDKKAEGGLMRLGFEKGSPPSKDRRNFLKLMGGLAALPVVGKFFKFAKPASKAVEAAKEATGIPSYFPKLVEKIKLLGDDITDTAATAERQKVTQYQGYQLTEEIDTGRKEIKLGDADYGAEEYMTYDPPETIIGKNNKPVEVAAKYDEVTVRPDMDGKMKDVEDGLDSYDDILKEVGEDKIKKAGGGLAYMLGE